MFIGSLIVFINLAIKCFADTNINLGTIIFANVVSKKLYKSYIYVH